MAFYGGHDSAFCIYSKEQDKFFTIELEKLLGIKHFSWPGNYQSMKMSKIFQGNQRAVLEQLKEEVIKLGLKPEFRHVVIGSTWGAIHQQRPYLLPMEMLSEYFYIENYSINRGHHLGHAWSAIMQLPPERGLFITCDGGGDDAYFTFGEFDRSTNLFKRHVNSQDNRHKIGGIYEGLGHQHLDSICQSSPSGLDIAGKIMGAAGYGKPVELTPKSWYEDSEHKKTHPESYVAYSFYGENNRFRFINKNHMTFQEECDACHTIQLQIEQLFDDTIHELIPDFEEKLEHYGRNIIFSGGFALNIINNMKLEEKYNCKIWVPCNPGDNGLPFGFLTKWLIENEKFSMSKRLYDNSFTGPPVRDLDRLLSYRKHFYPKAEKITAQEIARILKKGEVIALMHGNLETGFRALGNRSILCDASIEGIKDKVNLTKRRELYRPFAPICRWEDASKWFEVDDVNNYKHMNIAVKVREDANLPSITHIDGTARLQAIDEPGFMDDLLKIHGGVLLNTSMNLSGKPICNSLFEAFHILERTPLDKLIVVDGDDIWCFNETI